MKNGKETTDKYAEYPESVVFEMVGDFVNPYVEKGTNIPVMNIKGDMEFPNVYKKVDESGKLRTYRYWQGCDTIDYEEQVKKNYPSMNETKKTLENSNNTIRFRKRFIRVNRTIDPNLFEFLLEAPYEVSNAAKANVPARFAIVLDIQKAKNKIAEFELMDKANTIIKRAYEQDDKTTFINLASFFNMDANADPMEKYAALRDKANESPMLIINAVKSIEGSNLEVIDFGLQIGVLVQTKSGFTRQNGDAIKTWSLSEKMDAQQIKKAFAKWLNTSEGEVHKDWLKQEMSAKASEASAALMTA